jgi:hypothetical protein
LERFRLPMSPGASPSGAQVVPSERKLDRPVMEARFGRELWWEILFLALLLAAVEMTIARSSSPSAPDRG